jgi:hypothetical protein
MIKIYHISILCFYLLGSLLLPMGDFATLQELPQMYHNCKATEDKDMTIFDFLTDHLFNIDSIFDDHKNDDQKPHQTNQFPHANLTLLFQNNFNFIFQEKRTIQTEIRVLPLYFGIFLKADCIFKIFKPPIFS